MSKSEDNIIDCNICITIYDYHKNCNSSKYTCQTLETIEIFDLTDEILIEKINKYIKDGKIECDCKNKI
jgi:hypothetical protein